MVEINNYERDVRAKDSSASTTFSTSSLTKTMSNSFAAASSV
jgi:hypothetical protein